MDQKDNLDKKRGEQKNKHLNNLQKTIDLVGFLLNLGKEKC